MGLNGDDFKRTVNGRYGWLIGFVPLLLAVALNAGIVWERLNNVEEELKDRREAIRSVRALEFQMKQLNQELQNVRGEIGYIRKLLARNALPKEYDNYNDH